MKTLIEAYTQMVNDNVEKEFLTKVVNFSNDEKFKNFMAIKINKANNKKDFYFIIQDIADHFPNFSGAKYSKIPRLPENLAKHVEILSKKYN
jgi:hypothetical protein